MRISAKGGRSGQAQVGGRKSVLGVGSGARVRPNYLQYFGCGESIGVVIGV